MNKKRLCPICQTNYISRWDAKQCAVCYRQSPELAVRLQRQSKSANKQANEVRWGKKQRNDWSYSQMSPELAYVIGAYLTDGWVSVKSKTVALDNTSPEYVNYFIKCLNSIGVEAVFGKTRTKHHEDHKGRLPIIRGRAYSPNLTSWLVTNCNTKNNIPIEILNAPTESKIAFLAACIDGDGCIDQNGTIRLFGSAGYLEQVPTVLESLEIKTGGYKYIKTLPSGKRYNSVSIHRSGFVSKGGYCIIAFKQDRLLTANRKGQSAKTHVPCPNCGKEKSKRSKVCRQCFRVDETQVEHLRSIASKGGIARNRSKD